LGYRKDALSSCGLGYRKDALSILYSLLFGAIPFSSATDTVTFDSSAGAWQIGLGVDQQTGLGMDLFLVVTVAAQSSANVLKVVLPTQLPLAF
jgi:hypothetical protein